MLISIRCPLNSDSSPSESVTIYLMEPRTCEYVLGVRCIAAIVRFISNFFYCFTNKVESAIICDLLSTVDEYGLFQQPSTVSNDDDSEWFALMLYVNVYYLWYFQLFIINRIKWTLRSVVGSSQFAVVTLCVDISPQFPNVLYCHLVASDSTSFKCARAIDRCYSGFQLEMHIIGNVEFTFLSTKACDENVLDANIRYFGWGFQELESNGIGHGITKTRTIIWI